MRRVIKAVAAGGSIGDLSTLEDDASVDEVRQAIETLQTAEKTT
jgi:3-hydroxypropionyl-coenzyme A synthetase